MTVKELIKELKKLDQDKKISYIIKKDIDFEPFMFNGNPLDAHKHFEELRKEALTRLGKEQDYVCNERECL